MFALQYGLGITGVAADATPLFFKFRKPEFPSIAPSLKVGDVVHIKHRVVVPHDGRNVLVPAEYQDQNHETIKELTKRGIHVVLSALDGGIDLGEKKEFSRNNDTGSIYLCGVDPETGARFTESNYGERCDLYAWSRRLLTTDAWRASPEKTTSYVLTNGTEQSASLVAGVVALLQGIAYEKGYGPIPPRTMRQILVQTGNKIPKASSECNEVQPDAVKTVESMIAMFQTKKMKFPLAVVLGVTGGLLALAAGAGFAYYYFCRRSAKPCNLQGATFNEGKA